MAMTIFLMLNGLGIVFMLYVLANFWKEGHRRESDTGKSVTEITRSEWADEITGATSSIPRSAQSAHTVILFQERSRAFGDKAVRSGVGNPDDRPARERLISAR